MIRNSHMFSVLVSSVLVASATDATAQLLTLNKFTLNTSTPKSIVKSDSYSRSLGNSYLGLTGYAYGYMRAYTANVSNTVSTGRGMTLESVHARGYLRATGKLLKKTAELGRFDARGDIYSRTTGVSARGSVRLVLAGKTFINRSFSKDTSFQKKPYYMELFPVDPETDIHVWGPITLKVKGNAGVGIDCAGSHLLRLSNPALAMNYSARTWGQADADVSLGFYGHRTGVDLKGIFAEQTLGANLVVTPTRVRGSLGYHIRALTLKIRAYARARIPFIYNVERSKTLFSRSWGSFRKTLFSL